MCKKIKGITSKHIKKKKYMKKENFRYCPQKRKGQKRKKSIKREGQIGIKRIRIEITLNIFLKLSINKK